MKSSNDQLGHSNAQLLGENSQLRQDLAVQIERANSFERRVHILEETNASLEEELRAAIEAKKSASRMTTTNDEGLR